MSDDYYKLLDIEETATMEDIKKSYRRLSLKHHPDRNQNSAQSVDLFQKLSSAYETLSDPEKRKGYDFTRKSPFGANNIPFGGGPVDQMFADLFQNMGMAGGGGIKIDPSMFGAGMFPPFPPGANFQIFRNGVPVNPNAIQKPSQIIKTITINMKMVFTGGSVPLEVERWIMDNNIKSFEKITYYVDIFKGIDENEVIVLENKGNVVNDSVKGDVKVFIKIINDSEFLREGLDLILHKDISLKDAICGFDFDFKYLNDKVYTINNNEGNVIPPEYKKVIEGLGLSRETHTGNLIVHFHINFPTEYSKEKLSVLRDIL